MVPFLSSLTIANFFEEIDATVANTLVIQGKNRDSMISATAEFEASIPQIWPMRLLSGFIYPDNDPLLRDHGSKKKLVTFWTCVYLPAF